jgi:hypothetical protein
MTHRDERNVRRRIVAEEVCADAHERDLRVGLLIAVHPWGAVGLVRDDRVLPGEPVGCGLLPDRPVRVPHQPRVGRQQVTVSLVLGERVAEPVPWLG